ncbi:MAG: integrase [Sphingomonas sp. SCN 67-18]|uniref:tyrosine-type recombinase/integrase n=1 Tax=uncultured Sphingomonas sp. TaxID=158754 RepID=UPI0008689789|nr:tyrosine-type recombinase/integrase [Sphingomonas sp. SCN 67-18]ODU22743.1 MAG: integrase [Sphingomonas sp. SCN 67-18]
MGRDTSPYIVGDYWLDKRRDGKAPDIWQIASYAPKSRSVIYRSTKQRSLEDAKPIIHATVEKVRARKLQPLDEAKVIPQLILAYEEHGRHVDSAVTIAGSLRAFVGFLMQDEIGSNATVAELTQSVIARFIKWRMAPHSHSVPWFGKVYNHTSAGLRGESVQRNLVDIRAALNHAVAAGRIPYAPKIQSMPTSQRSMPRDLRFTVEQLGAIVGFTKDDIATHRWILLMIATACRPEAGLSMIPADQWQPPLLDIHPASWPRTKKHNPVVPVIKPFAMVLKAWVKSPHPPVRSRRTAWRTLRRALELPADSVPKTIRHTIATELRRRGVPAQEISGLLGHVAMNRTTEVYAKYDPNYLANAESTLTTIYTEVMAASEAWLADHLRTKVGNKPTIVIDKPKENVENTKA